jgi:hypothetical protein
MARRIVRQRALLGIARDVSVLVLLGHVVSHDGCTWLWPAIALAFGCLAYDVRLMWRAAGRRMSGEREDT